MESLTGPLDTSEFLGQMPCMSVGMQDAAKQYAATVVSPLAFIIILCSFYIIGVTVKPGIFNRDGLLNSIGEVLVEFYISVTIAIFSPFKCYVHPNGALTMKNSPSVI